MYVVPSQINQLELANLGQLSAVIEIYTRRLTVMENSMNSVEI